jgi:monofunctional glycosyltransferase
MAEIPPERRPTTPLPRFDGPPPATPWRGPHDPRQPWDSPPASREPRSAPPPQAWGPPPQAWGPPPSQSWGPPPSPRSWGPPAPPPSAPVPPGDPRYGVPPPRRPDGDVVRPVKPRKRRRFLRRVGKLLALVLLIQALIVLSVRWVDPPTTAFMLANDEGAVQEFVPVEYVSRNFLAAVIAHEDAPLPYRDGAFEWGDLFDRAEAHVNGEEDPYGSTIPQQVAKNLWLNQEMSAWRKALEAGLAWELGLAVDDRRMLELYVNYAQFGPTLYGVCAASWYYFDTPPSSLPADQAVQLVGLLPSPGHVQRAPGGGLDFQVEDGLGWLSRSHVINAQNRVPRHLQELGFQPVEDVGIPGLASDQPDADDDCSEMPAEVAELIAAEGTQ